MEKEGSRGGVGLPKGKRGGGPKPPLSILSVLAVPTLSSLCLLALAFSSWELGDVARGQQRSSDFGVPKRDWNSSGRNEALLALSFCLYSKVRLCLSPGSCETFRSLRDPLGRLEEKM